MRIDAHQHFWNYDPVRHEWINDEMRVIRKNFSPADLNPLLKQNRIDGSVVVQVDQTEAETFSLLSLAQQHSFIHGVVGWVDLASDNIEERLADLASHQKLKGFRHITQGLPHGFMLAAGFMNGIGSLSKYGFTYDVLIYPNQLEEATSFVRSFPNQKFVLDHLAKPFIKNATLEPWKKDIRELASNENVFCKLSGMVTESDWKNWKAEDFTPYIDTVIDSFGTKRVLYGSDWPVCLVASSYQRQLSLMEDYISRLSETEKSGIMGENAILFYNL